MASSYQKRFYYTFKNISNEQYTVEIWKYATDGTVTAQLVKGGATPLTITMAGIDDKFTPVRGTGVQISMLSESSMQFLELFTADMFGFMVKVYDKTSTIIWTGYIDAELYSEPLNALTNYEVSITCTDGFGLLDRLLYLDANGNKYTGLITQFDLLKFIIQKIGLPFTALFISPSTTIDGISLAAGETIFHQTYVQNENFYDEDGVAMDLRAILESILRPYGAFIVMENNIYYITDVHSLVNASTIVFKKYYTAFTYIGTATINTLIGDLSSIKFASTDQQLAVIPAYNKEVVTFSPYQLPVVLDVNFDSDFTGTTTMNYYGAYPNNFTQKYYAGAKNWTKTQSYNQFVEYNDNDDTDRYLRTVVTYDSSTNDMFTYRGALPKMFVANKDYTIYNNKGTWVTATLYNLNDVVLNSGIYYKCIQGNLSSGANVPPNASYWTVVPSTVLTVDNSSKYYLKIEADAYLRTTDTLGTATGVAIYTLNWDTKLTIGNRKYKYVSNADRGWVTTGTTAYFCWNFADVTFDKAGTATRSTIIDKWVALNDGQSYTMIKKTSPILVPLWGFTGNTIDFRLGASRVWGSGGSGDSNNTALMTQTKDVRLKNIKFTIVDSYGNDVEDKDIEYTGSMSAQNKDEGQAIDLIEGTNVNDFPVERGGLLCYTGGTYNWIKKWSRASSSDIVEKLLLRSYVGNYQNKTIELQATSNLLTTAIGYVTYSTYLSGKKFMVTSQENDLTQKTSKLTLQEIFVDNLTINSI